jgi:hypothetical protein
MRIRVDGRLSTTQVKASDAGQAKKLVQQQFQKATVLSVKRVDEPVDERAAAPPPPPRTDRRGSVGPREPLGQAGGPADGRADRGLDHLA